MRFEIKLGDYSKERGLRVEWVDGFRIAVVVERDEVTISGNAEGLRSLAQHLLTLADEQVPAGVHLHLEPGLELEDDSAALVLDKRTAFQGP